MWSTSSISSVIYFRENPYHYIIVFRLAAHVWVVKHNWDKIICKFIARLDLNITSIIPLKRTNLKWRTVFKKCLPKWRTNWNNCLVMFGGQLSNFICLVDGFFLYQGLSRNFKVMATYSAFAIWSVSKQLLEFSTLKLFILADCWNYERENHANICEWILLHWVQSITLCSLTFEYVIHWYNFAISVSIAIIPIILVRYVISYGWPSYDAHMREGNVFVQSVCVTVWAITFECLDRNLNFDMHIKFEYYCVTSKVTSLVMNEKVVDF